jgi:DNA-binding NarL/FixJ family response regulator
MEVGLTDESRAHGEDQRSDRLPMPGAPRALRPGRAPTSPAAVEAVTDQERAVVVLIFGQQRLLGDALQWLLRAAGAFEVAGVFTDAAALLEAVDRVDPDVVVLDTPMSPDALTAISAIRQRPRPAKVVVLVDGVDAATIDLAAGAHVDALMEKSDSGASIVMAVRQVLAGHTVFPSGWRAAGRQLEADARLAGLSRRQRDVLRLVADGRSNVEIAGDLFISVNTVKFHLRCIFRQLGIANRVQAAQRYAELTGGL